MADARDPCTLQNASLGTFDIWVACTHEQGQKEEF